MTKSSLILTLGVLLACTGVGALVHGRISQRWGIPADLAERADRLSQLPTSLGPWRVVQSEPLGEGVVRMLQCAGHLKRTYVHSETGAAVQVAVLLGPFGPISVHTPEICYSSREYDIQDARQRTTIRSEAPSTDELWSITFRARTVSADILRVYYGWNDGTSWSAPETPRMAYAGSPFLYKLQLACYASSQADARASDAGRDFLAHLLPAMDRIILNE
jgi:hypothetical protein